MKSLQKKDIIVFDLDGTLAPSKAVMDVEMSELFKRLLMVKKVAVMGGGSHAIFKMQLLAAIRKFPKALFKNLYLFPTTATAFYRYNNGWKKVYHLKLSPKERANIKKAFKEVFKEMNYVNPKKVYGSVIEDRGTQVTFSALGQDVVKVLGKKGIQMKNDWKDKYTPVKLEIARRMGKKLPEFAVHAAGFTSIDITRKGIDKAYGLHQVKKYIKVPIAKMAFVGDSLFPGGNDSAVKKTGVDWISVKDPEGTKNVIRKILQ